MPMSPWFEVRAAIRRRRGAPTLLDEWPAVSIVVPVLNAAGSIEACVRSIQLTSYDRYEVVLVDEGSTDRTADLMRALAAADLRIKVCGQVHAGPGAALNLGLHHAAGEVLMIMDVNVILARNTVKRILQGFGDTRTGAVCGHERPVRPSLLGARKPVFPIRAFRRSALEDIGPIPDSMEGVGSELTRRVRRAGYRVDAAAAHWN